MPYQKSLKLEISILAKDDLIDISQYTIANYGEEQMDVYLQSLYEGIRLLAENPGIGHFRDDLPKGYEIINIEKHVVVFTIKNDRLIIARIIHSSRDIKKYV